MKISPCKLCGSIPVLKDAIHTFAHRHGNMLCGCPRSMYICPNCGLKTAAQEWDIMGWNNWKTLNQLELWNMAQEYNAKDKLREIAHKMVEMGNDVYVFEKHKMHYEDTYIENSPLMCDQLQDKTFDLYYGLCEIEKDNEIHVIFECAADTDPNTISLEECLKPC